ncbi:MAG: hypothetical protein IPL61_28505 [Myxococcales bacterium]|nr:hypothetical protein [Myxococcales bacterium]
MCVVASLGCGGGGAAVGESCATVADCQERLQCLDHICRPSCLANIDCGDGRVCEDRACRLVESEIGAYCASEAACGPAQTCRLPVDAFVANGGTCQPEPTSGAIIGERCVADDDCRIGTCALGRCTELCIDDNQCLRGFLCTGIPRVSADASTFRGSYLGCLPSGATLTFDVPLKPLATQSIVIPIVRTATSMVVVAEAALPTDRIGVTKVIDPDNALVFTSPTTEEQYFAAALRHKPLPGVAVLQIPSTTAVPLQAGVYTIDVTSSADVGPVSLDGRRVRIVEKLGRGATLDLHFHFADLTDHPCLSAEQVLDADHAPTDPDFQNVYLAQLREIFAPANITIGAITYEPTNAPIELAGLVERRAGELFATSSYPTGVSVFFVRTLSPAGLEATVGGTPGAPLPATRASGIAVAATALCNNPDWEHLARITAHALARHMGLYRNREPEPEGAVDPLVDSPTSDENLMYWGEDGGTVLSLEQREILRRSPVLR